MGVRSYVVERVVEVVVLALAALVTCECELLLTGGAGYVAFLRSELVIMRAFLDSASSSAAGDEVLRVSAEEIRKLSGDIERGVQAYNTADLAASGGDDDDDVGSSGGLRALVERCARLPSAVWSLRRAAKDVLGLKERVLEAAERRKRYRVDVDCRCAGAGGRRRNCNHSCQENKVDQAAVNVFSFQVIPPSAKHQ
ncbi:unnamed protein product [Urochloa humidicola]